MIFGDHNFNFIYDENENLTALSNKSLWPQEYFGKFQELFVLKNVLELNSVKNKNENFIEIFFLHILLDMK